MERDRTTLVEFDVTKFIHGREVTPRAVSPMPVERNKDEVKEREVDVLRVKTDDAYKFFKASVPKPNPELHPFTPTRSEIECASTERWSEIFNKWKARVERYNFGGGDG